MVIQIMNVICCFVIYVAQVNAMTYGNPFLAETAMISHSGPSSSSAGSEIISGRQKRASIGNYGYRENLLLRSVPPTQQLQKMLLDQHNYYRRQVPSTNMMLMHWDSRLAYTAQRHANRCDFLHSRDRVATGENIWAAPYANYTNAVGMWYKEVHDRSCQCRHAYKHCCGHYVQVVWATSYRLGCGFAQCSDINGIRGWGHRNVLVCHYNPQGNTVFPNGRGGYVAMPAFKWATTRTAACSQCPSNAKSCHQGLCYNPSLYQQHRYSNNYYNSNAKQNSKSTQDRRTK